MSQDSFPPFVPSMSYSNVLRDAADIESEAQARLCLWSPSECTYLFFPGQESGKYVTDDDALEQRAEYIFFSFVDCHSRKGLSADSSS